MNTVKFKMIAVAALPLLLFILVTLFYVIPAIRVLARDLTESSLLAKLNGDIHAAQLYLEKHFGSLSLREGILVDANNYPISGRYELVDAISSNLGDAATVFVVKDNDFVRVITNIRNEDGTRAVGTFLGEGSAAYGPVKAGERYVGEARILGVPYYTAYDPLFGPDGSLIGILFVGVSKAEAEQITAAKLNSLLRTVIIVMAASTLLVIFRVIVIAGSVTRPLQMMQARLNDLASKGGDLTQRLEIKGSREITAMAGAVNKMVGSMRAIVAETREMAAGVDSGSEAVSAASEEMSASLEEVSASSSEFAGNAHSLSSSSQKMAAANAQILNRAEAGNKAIEETVLQMRVINNRVIELQDVITEVDRRSGDISKILSVITEIADQTNLLALNAAIEAARAGEQGRGFAVVAEEVRKLAEQSARAATEIGELIKTTQEQSKKALESMKLGVEDVAKGIEVVSKSGLSLTEILDDVSEIAGQVEETASAAQELSAGSQEMAASIEEQSSTMEEVAATAAELRAAAERLSRELQKFKVDAEIESAAHAIS